MRGIAADIPRPILVSGLLALLCALASCDTEADRVGSASIALADSLERAATGAMVNASEPYPTAIPASESVHLYIDASRSMAGFTGCHRSPTEFDIALDRLSVDLALTSVVRFGSSRRGEAHFEVKPFSRALHCPEFFSLEQNPDFRLFQRLLEDSTNVVSLYVTDGVQSDQVAGSQSPSVDALQEWFDQGGALQILALRSSFRGPAWSEQSQKWIGTAAVDRRPFYIFALGRSEAAVAQAVGRLSRSLLAQVQVLSFAPKHARCMLESTRLPRKRATPEPPWMMLEASRLPGVASTPTPVAAYTCTMTPEAPFESVLPVASLTFRRWAGAAFDPVGEPPDGTRLSVDSVTVTERQSTVVAALQAPRDRTSRFGFYELRMHGVPGRLTPAIDSLSTDDDSSLETFDRTYRFSWLVERLLMHQLSEAIPAQSLYFTLQYN